MAGPSPIPGSFRDPSGRVFEHEGRILRSITGMAAEAYERVRDAGVFERYARDGRLVGTTELAAGDHPLTGDDVRYVVEHPRLPFIAYPYEWPFALLKRAALFHLKLQQDLLGDGFVLSDASAYNVQFRGAEPVFIDALSIRPYRDGEYWLAHNQFCEQFLNPLLLQAALGVHYHEWYRGRLEGITSGDVARLLPLRKKLSFRMFTHVVGPAKLQSRSERRRSSTRINTRPIHLPILLHRNLPADVERVTVRTINLTERGAMRQPGHEFGQVAASPSSTRASPY